MAKVRRGVQMTAKAKRAKPGWKEELVDSEDEKLPDDEREASRLDWSAIEREVKTERDKLLQKEAAARPVKRSSTTLEYDDVAGDDVDKDVEAAEEQEMRRISEAAEKKKRLATDASADSDAEAADNGAAKATAEAASDDDTRPEGAITAGKGLRDKKRGGKNKTGSSKKKKEQGEEEDDSKKKRKKKEDEDPDRWVKMKLVGDEKEKRIDATRVVHYHDFDSLAAKGGDDDVVPASQSTKAGTSQAPSVPVAPPVAPPMGSSGGNFRSALRRDLWDDDGDDE